MDIDARARLRIRRSVAPSLALVLLAGAATLAIASLALADGEDGGVEDPSELARLAIDVDPSLSEPAIAALRALGPTGHAALMREHAIAIGALRESVAPASEGADRLRHAIDVVSGQRDGHASGLYWHTDLDAARGEARRTGRPILSLRLLGRLDEELSCANSRFFRVVLYPNAEIARALSTRFVLHWASERPAPRITIDMGDGRRIERTITGNSVHYVLDAEGRVLDALPGLYAPRQFRAALDDGLALAARCGSARGEAFARCMADAHEGALGEAERAWAARADGRELPSWEQLARASTRSGDAAPSALEAMPLAMGKRSMEMPMLRAMARQPADVALPDAIAWGTAAVADVALERLDANSIALVRLKNGGADVPGLAARIAAVAAVDGVRNEVEMHRRVHEWLAREPAMHALEGLNLRVYETLFLTPASDPWLGLGATDLWDLVEIER